MPRFVLLYHRCPPKYVRPSHWDLMLEYGDMLRTWAIAQLPQEWRAAHLQTVGQYSDCSPLAAGSEVEATQLADHRRDFLDYEGDLIGERGSVVRVAEGKFHIHSETANRIACMFEGSELIGTFSLSRENDQNDRWALSCGTRK